MWRRDVSAYGNPLFCLLSLPKVTHYCLAQLVQMAIGIVTDLWYEMWFRDSACNFLWGKIQYFSSYLIIERWEAFNPVTLQGAWDYVSTCWRKLPSISYSLDRGCALAETVRMWHLSVLKRIPHCSPHVAKLCRSSWNFSWSSVELMPL